jgi:hypothetical protein
MLSEEICEERRPRPFDFSLGRGPSFAQQAAEQWLGKALCAPQIARELIAIIETNGEILGQELEAIPCCVSLAFRIRWRVFLNAPFSFNIFY